MRDRAWLFAPTLALAMLGACRPELSELPACDRQAAQEPIFYDENGYPAYPGQALVEVSCGAGTFCHSQGILPEDRFGAPDGLDLDVGVALDPAGLQRLAYARRVAWNLRLSIAHEVDIGTMPPPGPDGETALAAAPRYMATAPDGRVIELPAIDSPEGRAMLENWLACGAQVIEGVEGTSTGVGDIVPLGSSCPAGQAMCGGSCIDVTADPANCGGCGIQCGSGQGCADGACFCFNGLAACGPSCVDLATDGANCGACGAGCGALFCAGSQCVDMCPAGTTDCGGSCVDLQSNLANCGGCGSPCGAGEVCSGGVCSCAAGFQVCGGGCVDTQTSSAHCGMCDNPCGAQSTCAGGSCQCGGGTMDCGSGCVDTSSSLEHCGGCNSPCNAGEGCVGGTCVSCGPSVSFEADIQPIFNGSCLEAGCHTGARPAASMSLEPGRAWSELVNVAASCGATPLVTPGDVAASYIINKLTGSGMCSGTQMPKRGQSLPPTQIELIESWICRGAAND